MTETKMWQNLEIEGLIKNKGSKHVLTKPEVKKQLEEDIRLVAMNQKEPDEELKALVGFIKRHHGWRHYVSRSERDKAYCDKVTQDQIISEIVFWELVVAKTQAVGGGMAAAGATARASTARVTATSQYGVDTLSHGMSHQTASAKMNATIKTSQLNLSKNLRKSQQKEVKVRIKKEEED